MGRTGPPTRLPVEALDNFTLSMESLGSSIKSIIVLFRFFIFICLIRQH